MNYLKGIPIVRQDHPELNLHQPFEIVPEYHHGPMEDYYGDMHYALQLCMIIHGSMDVVYANHRQTYHEGQLFWTMFWEPHAFRFTGKRNLAIAVNIDLDQLGNCDPFGQCCWLIPFVIHPNQRFCPRKHGDRERYRQTAKTLLRLWNQRPPNWKQRSWFMIHQIILQALDFLQDPANGYCKAGFNFSDHFFRIKPALVMLEKSVGKPPSLKQAASACSLSVSRFSDIFRCVFETSYGKFAMRSRLSAAAKDMTINRLTIEETADKWGFTDSSHFANAFKKLYCCSPTQYLKKL